MSDVLTELVVLASRDSGPPWWLVFVAVALAFGVMSHRKRRPCAHDRKARRIRPCPGCHAEHPGHARFCRRCGTSL